MKRRDFLTAASGVAGGTAAAGAASSAAAKEESEATTTTTSASGTTTAPNGTTTGGNATTTGTAPATPDKTVKVGPGGNLVFEPANITVSPGTTVKWVWESDTHNIVVSSQPDGANWNGTAGGAGKTYDTGHTYTHTFDTKGTYEYYCAPHRSAGMKGSVEVKEGGAAKAKEIDPHHMGVPFQAHYVGIAAILMLVSSLLFTFYLLKYGESPNASSPNRK